jgi:hypothetical protein
MIQYMAILPQQNEIRIVLSIDSFMQFGKPPKKAEPRFWPWSFDFFPFKRPGIEIWGAGGYDCTPILISEG